MVKIQITAGGIYGADGELPIGTELDLEREPAGWAGRYTVLSSGGAGKESATGDAYVPVGPYAASDTGGGWWTITDANGKPVGKKLRKDDAEAFNGLSDEDKAELLKGEA